MKSSKSLIKYGVSQRSILRPLLFILYINDIGIHLQNSFLDIFACYSTLCTFGDTSYEIENKPQLIVMDWCSKYNMSLYPNKTKCMFLVHKKIETNEGIDCVYKCCYNWKCTL